MTSPRIHEKIGFAEQTRGERRWGYLSYNKRSAKFKQDSEAINRSKFERAREEYEKFGVVGAGKLMEKGNIKEAAAVFSEEGLSAFAKMFSNHVEQAVNTAVEEKMKGIESVVSDTLEKKILEVLEGLTDGFRKFNTDIKPTPSEDKPVEYELNDSEIPKADEILVDPPVEKEESKQRVSGKRRVKYNILATPEGSGLESFTEERKVSLSNKDIEFVLPYFEYILKLHKGEPVKSTDVVRTLKNQFNINLVNATSIWNKVMSLNPNVEKAGFGLYKYDVKTFSHEF